MEEAPATQGRRQSEASEELVARFEGKVFSVAHIRRRLENTAREYPQVRSFSIDLAELGQYDPELAETITEQPDACRESAEEAIARLQLQTPAGEEFRPHARFFNTPDLPPFRPLIIDLGSAHLDRLVSVNGVISSITEIKPRMMKAEWLCMHCGDRTLTLTEKTTPLMPPYACPNQGCRRNNFQLIEKASKFIDMQKAQVQDPVEKMRGNIQAVQADLWLEDDLTNKLAPGEKVIITGMLRLKPVTVGRSKSSVYSKFLDVAHIEHLEEDFEELEITQEEEEEILKLSRDPKLFEKIVGSIAPSLYGYKELKSAVALQLFGGTAGKQLPDGEKVRSDMHILMIGDPGTGKSTLLEYISHLAPKCIVVSGGGSSGVGLTASAEKEEGGEGWVLKAGAMVLANGGLVGIDEMDKMKEEDRGAIHQAMEQQHINIAKAGIVTSFQTRTSVLAAANPKLGRFDPNLPPATQFALSPALMSRFDLIFTMRDVLDDSRDRELAGHILAGHKYATSGEKVPENSPILPMMPIDLLRKYIAYARKNVAPMLTDEAAEKMRDYYVNLRRIGKEQNTFPVTARHIEALVRLSEASAKLRLSPTVETYDAQMAVDLVDFVLHEVFVDKETGKLDSDVINLGQAKSKVDKVRNILNVIVDLERQYDIVPIDDIVREAANYGVDEFLARQMIDDLKRKGELYEPKAGFIKLARPKEW